MGPLPTTTLAIEHETNYRHQELRAAARRMDVTVTPAARLGWSGAVWQVVHTALIAVSERLRARPAAPSADSVV